MGERRVRRAVPLHAMQLGVMGDGQVHADLELLQANDSDGGRLGVRPEAAVTAIAFVGL